MKHSASPFALGQRGVIFRWWKPRCSAKFLNSMPLKGGPLSLFKTSGIPFLAKIASSFGMVDLECDNFNFWETAVFVYDDHEVLSSNSSRSHTISQPRDARVKFLESKWLWHFTQSEIWWSIFEWNYADITSWWRWSRAAKCRNSRNRSFFQWPIYSPSLKSSLFLNVACIESHLQPCVTSQAESLYQRLSGSTSSLLWRLWSSFKAAPRIITVRLVR